MSVDSTIIQSDTISQATDGWSVPISFQQFDPSAGTLISVGLSLTGTVTGIAALENLGVAAATVPVSLPGTITLNAGTVVAATAYPIASQSISLGAYDGTVDFAGGSGTIATFSNASPGTLSNAVGSLSSFVGTGTIAWTASSSASLSEASNGNILSVTRAEAGATINLRYDATGLPGSNAGSTGASGSGSTLLYPPVLLFNTATLAPQVVSVADATSGWGVTRSINQFDPSQGTLVAVEVTAITHLDTGLVLENLGSIAGVAAVGATAQLSVAAGGSILAIGTAADQTAFSLAAFDGAVDFAGPSGASLAGLARSETVTSFVTQGLTSFVGAGTVDLQLNSAGFAQLTGPADLAFEQLLEAGGTVAISYIFQPGGSLSGGTGSLVTGPLAILGAQAGQADIQTAIDHPFASVSIVDSDPTETDTLTITESNPLNGIVGSFLDVIPYNNPNFDSTTGVYTVQGTAADLTAILQGLEFQPANGTILPGQTIETDFTISVEAPGGTLVTDTTTSVIQVPGVFVDTIAASLGVQAALADTTVTGIPFISQTQAVACFAGGTRIATPSGVVPVERLREGDLVVTSSGVPRPIVWIGRRALDCRRHADPERVRPVRIARHAFGMNRPARALLLSPDHAVYVDDVLIPVKFLINNTTIVQTRTTRVTYYHLELAHHDVVLAENLPCESYLETGGRSGFENGGPALDLFPDFAGPDAARVGEIWRSRACAPLIADETILLRVQARLGFQAVMLQAHVSHRRTARRLEEPKTS